MKYGNGSGILHSKRSKSARDRTIAREPYGVGDVKCPRQVGLSSGGRSHRKKRVVRNDLCEGEITFSVVFYFFAF